MVNSADQVHQRILASVRESDTDAGRKLGFHAMGTWCQITFTSPTPNAIKAFATAALRWVAEFEARYSRFIPDSLICRINAAAGRDWVEVDAVADRIFSLCEELVFFTRGAFDPTSLPLITLWNWKANPPVIPGDDAVRAARELVGWDKVQRKLGAIFLPVAGMCIDLGGIGKEYAVDCAVALAQQHGIADVLVDFGQDVRAMGQPPERDAWYIGLEDPTRPGNCRAGVAVRNMAVASSGDYLRCFHANGRRYGHILDPRSGYPVWNGCRSVTVIAPSCTVAGVLSTTGFVVGAQDGINLIEGYQGAEGCILTEKSRFETRRFASYVVQES
jgi:thiamine biosynthesis lipoprotein